MDNIKQKVDKLETVGLLDNRIKELTFESLQEASERNWRKVSECFRELAFICARKGLQRNEFLLIRKEIILAMEKDIPLAKIYIEDQEKRDAKTRAERITSVH